MIMRKTTDSALISVPKEKLNKVIEVVNKTKLAHWASAFSEKHNAMLIRQRATGRWIAKAAKELEDSLAKALPGQTPRVEWAWTAGGEELYFPGTEILVLFEEGTTEAERKKILRKIKGLKVETYPNAKAEPPKQKPRRTLRGMPFPGFSKARVSQARKRWEAIKPDEPQDPRADRPSEIVIPVARAWLPETRRNDLFAVAGEIKSLPKVRAATPDVSVLGEHITGSPQLADFPPISSDSFHRRNRVDFVWRLVNPSDLGAPSGWFLASREKVAVLDSGFALHPDITYELIGFDAADHDHDPMSPTENGLHHGLEMSGVIGGVGQDDFIYDEFNHTGIAPGAVIVPVRYSWSTEDDFHEVNGQTVFDDFYEYVERYTTNWVEALIRLYQLSFQGVEIANISRASNPKVWQEVATNLSEWINWWLRDGNYPSGVFAAASAGNNEANMAIATPAGVSRMFAVGCGEEAIYNNLGNSGWGLELVADDGRWPAYTSNGDIIDIYPLSGGSSVASAVVAGTVAIMKNFNPFLTADEIRTILRLTTRKVPSRAAGPIPPTATTLQGPDDEDAWDGWRPGYSNMFGNGFLDAHYAAELAWRKHYPSAEMLQVKYRSKRPSHAMIQLRLPPKSSLAGKRVGMFWSSFSDGSTAAQRWLHDRDDRLQSVDQAVDAYELPFGEQIVVGDFDGDALDEMALQLHPSEFWPDFCAHPPQSLLAFKFDEAEERWKAIGARSPYAEGAAAPQIVFPAEQTPVGMFAADLKGDGKQCPVAWGGELINALQYDESSNTFRRLDPGNYRPPLYSPAVEEATGRGRIVAQAILKVAPLWRSGSRQLLMIVGSITKLGIGAVLGTRYEQMEPGPIPEHPDRPHLPGGHDFADYPSSGSSDFKTSRFGSRSYMTVSVVGYDEATSQWVNYSFSPDPEETHLLLDEDSVSDVEAVIQGEFGYPGKAALNEVVIHLANDHFYTLHMSDGPGYTFTQTAVYRNELQLFGRISRLRAGRFGFDGDKMHLAWLTDSDHDNRVYFLKWNQVMHGWQVDSQYLTRPKPDNQAINLAVLKGFPFASLAGDQDVIALLMGEPDANVYLTYRYQDPGGFQYMGLI
jgi:hypothetical protein